MSKIKVLCYLTNILCEYCYNKRFNYGWFSGTASYCRKKKMFCDSLKECPIGIKINKTNK